LEKKLNNELAHHEVKTIKMAKTAWDVARDKMNGDEAFQHAFVMGALYEHIMTSGRDYVFSIDGDDAAIIVQWAKGSEFIRYPLSIIEDEEVSGMPSDQAHWWERVADDPDGSFKRLAESRDMTVEQLNVDTTFPDFFSVDNGDIVIMRAGAYEITFDNGPCRLVYFPAGHRITEQMLGRTDEHDNPIFEHPVVHMRVDTIE
jgi:hypothetical protein